MKISREARNKYQLDDFKFSEKGNLVFEGEIYPVRMLVQQLNQKRDLINFPETGFKVGYFNAVALIFEINDYLIESYNKEYDDISIKEDLYEYLSEEIGEDKLLKAMEELVEEFPPEPIYKNKIKPKEYLNKKSDGKKNRVEFIDEFLNLWLGNSNPAFSSYSEFFDDNILKHKKIYRRIQEETKSFFEDKPKFGPKNQNLLEMLTEPFEEHPHEMKKQLEFMHENWEGILGKYAMKILVALDLIREEEKFRGLGPGEAKILEYGQLEFENFTPDKEWMPKVVMIAKHTYVWLDQLSKRYGRSITKLDEIPNEELEQLKQWGFNSLWLIGVWQRSKASKTIKNWCGNPDAAASAYSVYDYVIADELGGHNAYEDLKRRANERGLRLASDMVPNHTGIVSKWTKEHPDWYIQLDHKPFPSYSYSGQSLGDDPNIGFYLEDKYFTREDAAVTFKRVNHETGKERFIYHGNDGTSFPWNDTAQLNYLLPEVREAVIQTILYVSRLFPIIRFDAAMTLTRKHFQRLWFPEPGTGGAIPSRAEHGITREEFFEKMPKEFWREVVDRINEENPDTLLIAEAFWLLEGFFVRTLGMHRVYNSAFMNMLREEDNAKYRAVLKNTLEFDPKILKRFVNFMNNPDEETAIKQFGDGDKYFGVCTMMVTMPGLPMFGHGQIKGFEEKYGMEFRKAYWDESIKWDLVHQHERKIFPLMKKRYLFADVKNFLLYDFQTGGHVNEDVYAYSNRINNERGLIIFHNKYKETKGVIKRSVGFAVKDVSDKKIIQKSLAEGLNLPKEGYCIFRDYITNLEYIRKNQELHEKGLYVELKAFESHAFMDFRIVHDDEFFHYAQLHDLLNGRGVHDINSTYQKVVYQPLHAPFEKIVKTSTFQDFIEAEQTKPIIEKISPDLQNFLEEVRKYSSSENENIDEVKNQILKELEIGLQIDKILKDVGINHDSQKIINEIIPQDDFEWGILFSWILIHSIGKIASEKDYELISRSWIDEWQLSKYIQLTLEGLKEEEEEKSWKANTLIKLLTSQQNLMVPSNIEEEKMATILKRLFTSSDAQQYLNVNRYKETLWFNAEAFFTFCDWFLLINAITTLRSYSGDEIKTLLRKYINIIENWKKYARQSEFKVNKLIELIEK